MSSSESSWGYLRFSTFLEQLVEQAQIDQLVELGFLLQHPYLERMLSAQKQRRGHRVDGELELFPCLFDQGRLEWLAGDLGNQVRDIPLCPRRILGDEVSRVQIAGQQGLDRVRVRLEEVGAHGEQSDGELLVRPEVALVDKDLAAGLNKPGGIGLRHPGADNQLLLERFDDLRVVLRQHVDVAPSLEVGPEALRLEPVAQCDVLGVSELGSA